MVTLTLAGSYSVTASISIQPGPLIVKPAGMTLSLPGLYLRLKGDALLRLRRPKYGLRSV